MKRLNGDSLAFALKLYRLQTSAAMLSAGIGYGWLILNATAGHWQPLVAATGVALGVASMNRSPPRAADYLDELLDLDEDLDELPDLDPLCRREGTTLQGDTLDCTRHHPHPGHHEHDGIRLWGVDGWGSDESSDFRRELDALDSDPDELLDDDAHGAWPALSDAGAHELVAELAEAGELLADLAEPDELLDATDDEQTHPTTEPPK